MVYMHSITALHCITCIWMWFFKEFWGWCWSSSRAGAWHIMSWKRMWSLLDHCFVTMTGATYPKPWSLLLRDFSFIQVPQELYVVSTYYFNWKPALHCHPHLRSQSIHKHHLPLSLPFNKTIHCSECLTPWTLRATLPWKSLNSFPSHTRCFNWNPPACMK